MVAARARERSLRLGSRGLTRRPPQANVLRRIFGRVIGPMLETLIWLGLWILVMRLFVLV